ncbi:MAG: winged helix-turn-helix domain-containing protein [Steroidobacteraceae bacterium]
MATITPAQARGIWLRAQRLDVRAPFGAGAEATRAAVEHLGYVQIDTIHVIERCHHQILYTRIPDYERSHLHRAQAIDKSVFEYWTHALAYVPTRDLRYFRRAMLSGWRRHSGWFGTVTSADLRKVLARIRREGALTIRDIDDDVLVDKTHEWASRKPSKRALQAAFFQGRLVVSERRGMVKTYELADRHFGWARPPAAAPEREVAGYLLDRALRSQGLVSLDSICHLDAPRKPALRRLIGQRVRAGALVPVSFEGAGKTAYWASPMALEEAAPLDSAQVHVLSPFDPLVIQRRRLAQFFGYEHRFEAYVPKAKRQFGYFAQPVLVGDRIVAAIDLKADRERGRLLVQQWNWIGKQPRRLLTPTIEEALHRFERFQLARGA